MPTAGEVRLLDGDPWADAVDLHRRLAYVPGDVNLWPNLSGGEIIDLLGRLRGGLDERRRADLIEQFDLDPTKKARTYSKGNRQKVALVAALASDVELLLLDEPTSGLDPLMASVFQQCVDQVKEEGRTVLLSSHILAEVESLADRLSIIRAGTDRRDRHARRPPPPHPDVRVGRDHARRRPASTTLAGVHNVEVEGKRVRFDVDTPELDAALKHLTTFGVRTLASQPPTLEELFLRVYRGDDDGDGSSAAPASRRRGEGRRMSRRFAGTAQLVRFILRRDRVRTRCGSSGSSRSWS